jgi:hypothetical protein
MWQSGYNSADSVLVTHKLARHEVLTAQNVRTRSSGMWCHVGTVGSKCSGFQLAVNTNFNTSVSTSCDWFWGTTLRPRGLTVGCPHCPVIVQITLSSVKLCLSLSGVDCRQELLNETFLQLSNVFQASKECFSLFRIMFYALYYIWGYFTFLLFYLVFWVFIPKKHCNVCDCLSITINHKHCNVCDCLSITINHKHRDWTVTPSRWSTSSSTTRVISYTLHGVIKQRLDTKCSWCLLLHL